MPADRAALIRAVHYRARRLGLQEADRRAVQRRATGVDSCARMDLAQLRAVLRELDLIAARRRARPDSVPVTPTGRLLMALWRDAYLAGVVRDSSHIALCAWIRRQTGLDAARFATGGDVGRRCVEALRAMLRRGGAG